MTVWGWLQIAAVAVIITLLVKPVGAYLYKVFEGEKTFLGRGLRPVERAVFSFLGVDPEKEYSWSGYLVRLVIIDFVFILFAYVMLRLQGHLPLNPAHIPSMKPTLAFNTSISFGTNTNWQAYAGETQATYLSQMLVFTTLMFTSAASGIILAIAFFRGLSRKGTKKLGSIYADYVRAVLHVLIPLAIVITLIIIPMGVIQTMKGPVKVKTPEGAVQQIPRGPVASLESIKHIGNNGGGFFNANAAHPFENPNPITNVIFMVLMLLIPASMTYTLGRYVGSQKQGWAIFIAIMILLMLFIGLTYVFEAQGNPNLAKTGVNTSAGNTEGKEVRNGTAGSAAFAGTTVSATTGSVNSSHDSYTAMGGFMLISAMMLNTIFGSCGAGMINIMMYAIFAVFIAGLMVGRTPEFRGKKIESREVRLAVIALLAHPLCILFFVALAMAIPSARAAAQNGGAHALTTIAYAFTSATANNGSAFGGLTSSTTFYTITTGLAMLIGRYVIFIPMMAVAGSLAAKQAVPESEGTFPTDTPLFSGLLVGTFILIGALTFFPILALGPLAEQFAKL